MTPKQIREIAEAMRDCGIEYLKLDSLVLKACRAPSRAFSMAPGQVSPSNSQPAPVASAQDLKDPPVEGGPPLEEEKIPHNIQALQSLLKMSDVELVDQLFPEPTEPAEDIA